MDAAEELVCAIIRGDAVSARSSSDQLQQVVDTAFRHSVNVVVFDALKRSPAWNDWLSCLRQRLQNAAFAAATLDVINEQELQRVLICLDRHRIRPLLLKGVPLAYTIYESPALRPRGDTDLLIKESDLHQAVAVLRTLGYDGPDPQTGKITSYQCVFSRRTEIGIKHNLDLHWRINNAQLFANTFTFDELLAGATEIPSLAPCALGLGYTHALLLACMHCFAHAHAPFYVDGGTVYAGHHLRWLYDIHLLCSAFSLGQWFEFASLALVKGIAKFCLDSLNRSKEAFNTQIPAEITHALQTAAQNEAASAEILRTSARAWIFANLRALPKLSQRIKLIQQTIFPSAAYMMEKYRCNMRLALPFLYGYRSIKGTMKAFKRTNLR